ncbi:nidogen-2-like [Saccostrea echinata]|uniref:nidogen-2-like n=1 Tax=Saccostrea echinata TaxID=191078 RepID=UPI002A81F49C|nr:nidogen-2-like [Saccostrea echinata]
MWLLVLILGYISVSEAIVCTPQLCENIKIAPLQCKGSIIKGGGFCGCTDACAKQEGESCDLPSRPHLFGMIPSAPCDDGLECTSPISENHSIMRLGKGVCSTSRKSRKTRSQTYTPCQQMYMQRSISMVIWNGWYLPKCDGEGNFEAEQCDNTGHCFCVTPHKGQTIENTKVLGSADCSAHAPAKRDLTRCQQMYQLRMISFVIYHGMWTPKCDADGKFEPVQCDNTQHCFCVTELTGTVVKGSKVAHRNPDCSIYDLTENPTTTTVSFT